MKKISIFACIYIYIARSVWSIFHNCPCVNFSNKYSSTTTNIYDLSSQSFIKIPYTYHLPGITVETIETCSRLLQHNHEHYHIFFNSERRFHNHATHYLLAAFGLGASSHTLEHIYEEQKKIQQPRRPLHDNKDFDVNKCLGDENYYGNYLEFFRKELESEKYHGKIEDLIEDYLFNKDYLDLVFNGAYHPFIHLGYALEFQVKIMAVEGLAMASVDRVHVKDVLKYLNYDQNKVGNKTALDIIELIIKDQRFDDKVFYHDEGTKVNKLLERGGGPLIAEYVQMWKCDLDDLRRASVLVNAAVIRPKKALRLNFFLMHATTSGLFLDIFVRSLKKKENQLKFLRAKFAVDLVYYVACGRPKLNVNYLLNEYQPSKEHSYSDAQNPWLPLIDKCLTHRDMHLVKVIRALVYAEKFDGTQKKDKISYLKIAQMTMDALFPANKKKWSHDGVGWEEYWNTVEDS